MLAGIQSLSPVEACLIAVSGLIVVFIMLGILALLIMVISKGVGMIDASRKTEPAPKKAAAPKPAAPAAPAAPVQDQDELVAVLMAAIAAESDSSPDSFRITSIQSR